MKHVILSMLLCIAAIASTAPDSTVNSIHKWEPFSDVVAGGTSAIRVSQAKDAPKTSRHAMRVEGELVSKFAYPFAGAHAYFTGDNAPQDISKYSGIQFWIRGDGRTYGVQMLSASIKDYNYHSKPFSTNSTWTLVKIPFTELKQMIPNARKVDWTGADIQGVGFQASGFLGPFWLEISDVKLFK